MPREQRVVADEPKRPEQQLRPPHSAARWPHGVLRVGSIAHVKTPLRYKVAKSDDPYRVENRWYYCGAVNLAFVQVYKPGTMRSGDFCLHITSRVSSNGVWFTEEDELHAFIQEELKREPL